MEKQRVRVSELQAADRGLSLRAAPGEVSGNGTEQQPHRQPQVGRRRSFGRKRTTSEPDVFLRSRLATNNNLSKSESDQEDNDDLNDNDWSYGAEKKGQFLKLYSGIRICEPQSKEMLSAVTAKKRKVDKVFFFLLV